MVRALRLVTVIELRDRRCLNGTARTNAAEQWDETLHEITQRRIPRDPNDWSTATLAMVIDAGILTGDHDFLGCGCPTRTVETLRVELGKS